jgi:hypothetical protein
MRERVSSMGRASASIKSMMRVFQRRNGESAFAQSFTINVVLPAPLQPADHPHGLNSREPLLGIKACMVLPQPRAGQTAWRSLACPARLF